MTRLIKKYKNRRLYDMEISQYVTGDKLIKYVKDGIPFKVVDSATQEDITNATLLQIFVEMESGATQFLSPDILRQLIILAQHPMNEMFRKMLEQFFKSMGNQLQNNPYLANTQQANAFWQQQMQDLFTPWQELFKTS